MIFDVVVTFEAFDQQYYQESEEVEGIEAALSVADTIWKENRREWTDWAAGMKPAGAEPPGRIIKIVIVGAGF